MTIRKDHNTQKMQGRRQVTHRCHGRQKKVLRSKSEGNDNNRKMFETKKNPGHGKSLRIS